MKTSKELISIVIPCFNEEETINLFYDEFNKVSKKMKSTNFELLFIDDGSKDKTLDVLEELSKKDTRVRFISFSRNFGKEAGILAGLRNATGDFIAIMDVDLQDPPEMLETMYKELKTKNYDCVALYTKSHEDYGVIRNTLTNIWYKIIKRITNSTQKAGARDFRLMTRRMVDSILSLKEYNRYSKGLFDYVGFQTKWIEYDAPKRVVGKSKYSIRKLIKYAFDGIVSYSTSLLLLSAYIGLFFCLISFITIIVIITKTLIWGDPVSGWPSLACLIVFIGGVQLFFFGIMGMYLSKIYLEVKQRPIYIIKATEKGAKKYE